MSSDNKFETDKMLAGIAEGTGGDENEQNKRVLCPNSASAATLGSKKPKTTTMADDDKSKKIQELEEVIKRKKEQIASLEKCNASLQQNLNIAMELNNKWQEITMEAAQRMVDQRSYYEYWNRYYSQLAQQQVTPRPVYEYQGGGYPAGSAQGTVPTYHQRDYGPAAAAPTTTNQQHHAALASSTSAATPPTQFELGAEDGGRQFAA